MRLPRAWVRRLARDESGQAMVEFVLVFPMQLLLTLAIIQFAFLQHAHVVVAQAAWLGARAASVSDMMEPRISAQEAAKRVVARQLGVLTMPQGTADLSAGASVTHRLEWGSGQGRLGYSDARQRQVYRLLRTVAVRPNDVADNPDGYVSCYVEYDYLLSVPVANHLIAQFSGDPGPVGWTTFRVRRAGFVATPWSVPPP